MTIDLLGPDPALIIGLMSGTSVDSIDAAVVRIQEIDGSLKLQHLFHHCSPWSPDARKAILSACRVDAPLRDVALLNFLVGEAFGAAAAAAAKAAGISLDSVDAIASHGQTLWHQPEPMAIGGMDCVGTVQVGEAAVISARTGCLVVADFRVADMAVGGQGAPLVPYADFLTYANSRETRVVQNIGGIANLTLIPADSGLTDVVAFDTGPGNMVMDAIVRRATNGGAQCDLNGQLASAGRIDTGLLSELLEHEFFALPPPKSTGREHFGEAYSDRLFAVGVARGLSVEDMVATAAALTVESIARAYEQFLNRRIDRVILSGGGARNPALTSRLRKRIAPVPLSIELETGISVEAKEAAAFAILGYCTLRGRPSNVPSATGAKLPAVLGKITQPPITTQSRGHRAE